MEIKKSSLLEIIERQNDYITKLERGSKTSSVFDDRKRYTQSKIIDKDHLDMDVRTFHKYYTSDKDFPNPLEESGTHRVWLGRSLNWYLDKKSER